MLIPSQIRVKWSKSSLNASKWIVVVSVNVDADRRRVASFLKQYNISLPVYYAAPEDAGPLTAGGIPSTFILGPDRALVDRAVGYSPQWEERWKKVVEKYLKPRK